MNLHRMTFVATILMMFVGLWGYALFSGRADLARGGQALTEATEGLAHPLCEISDWLLTGDVATVQRAHAWLSQALRNDAQLAQAYLLRGQAACLLGDYAAAVTDLGQFTRLQPDNPLGWVELGFALDASGSLEGAAVVWQRAGLNADAFLSEAERLRREGAYADALRWLQYAGQFGAALPSEQAFIEYLAVRGTDVVQSTSSLEQAVTLDTGWLNPHSRLDAWRFWGQQLYESQQYQAAQQALQYALQIAPADAAPAALSETYRFLGLSHWALGDLTAAESAFVQAVDVFPGSVWAQVHFAAFRYKIGLFSAIQTQQVFDTVLQTNLNNQMLWRYVVKFWLDAGEDDAATQLCNMAKLNNLLVNGCSATP